MSLFDGPLFIAATSLTSATCFISFIIWIYSDYKFITFVFEVILTAALFFLFVGASNLAHNPIILELTKSQAIGITVGCAVPWAILIGGFVFYLIVVICQAISDEIYCRNQLWLEQHKTNNKKTQTSRKKYTISIGKQSDNIPSSLVNKIINNIYKEILKKSEFESYADAINNSKIVKINVTTESKYKKIVSILNKFGITHSVETN